MLGDAEAILLFRPRSVSALCSVTSKDVLFYPA